MNYEYDPRKAATNLRKHGVSFDDAISVLEGDASAYTDFDPAHSAADLRFFTIGISSNGKMLFISHMRGMASFASSVRDARHLANGNSMKTQTSKPAPQKPTAKSRTAVRGKYFNQLPKGTNLAIIDPALHHHFPDSESVNRALQALLTIRESLQTTSPRASSTKRQAA